MNLKSELLRYSISNCSEIDLFQELECDCGSNIFELYSDDNEGGAYCICTSCNKEIDIENSKKYIDDCFQNGCNCDSGNFNISIGMSCYENSSEIKWVYVGAKCTFCGLAGVYVDWKIS